MGTVNKLTKYFKVFLCKSNVLTKIKKYYQTRSSCMFSKRFLEGLNKLIKTYLNASIVYDIC